MPYIQQIFDHAHAVLGAIAFVQLFQPLARELFASITKRLPGGSEKIAILNAAHLARFIFGRIIDPTARTGALVPLIGHAQITVHATWRNMQGCFHYFWVQGLSLQSTKIVRIKKESGRSKILRLANACRINAKISDYFLQVRFIEYNSLFLPTGNKIIQS